MLSLLAKILSSSDQVLSKTQSFTIKLKTLKVSQKNIGKVRLVVKAILAYPTTSYNKDLSTQYNA